MFEDRFCFARPALSFPAIQSGSIVVAECDATMYHMKTASIRDLRYDFKKIEHLLSQGEEIQITRRRKVIARLGPGKARRAAPDARFPRKAAGDLWRQDA